MDWSECFASDVQNAAGVPTIQCLEVAFTRIVTFVAAFASIVFFVMLLVGGFRYLSSAGNPKTAEGAKGTITAAFLGLILVIVGYLILVLIKNFTGVNVTEFIVPGP